MRASAHSNLEGAFRPSCAARAPAPPPCTSLLHLFIARGYPRRGFFLVAFSTGKKGAAGGLTGSLTDNTCVRIHPASIRKLSELPSAALSAPARGIVLETDDQAKEGQGRRREGREGRERKGREGKEGKEGKEWKGRKGKGIVVSSSSRLQDVMIESLSKLRWKRVDVKLHASVGSLPHNHIQARPPDEHGMSVTHHLMRVLTHREEEEEEEEEA